MQKAKVIAIAVLALLVVIIVLQNTEVVETRLLFVTIALPRAALLFGTLVAGFAIGVLMAARIMGKKKTDANEKDMS